MDKMYSFDEVSLIPAMHSSVCSRKEVSPYYEGNLPIFVAPMTCIVSRYNINMFSSNGFIPIYPIKHNDKFRYEYTGWTAITLNEAKNESFNFASSYLLIDCANGHMGSLFEVSKKLRSIGKTVMIGNIANPLTYLKCCFSGVSYVRVGIGGGSGCTTSVQTGIHASLPWLLYKINKIRKVTKVLHKIFPSFVMDTKVVADGGINSVDKMVKALGLGADYVMMGSYFAQCTESWGKETETKVDGKTVRYKEYYGQSSAKGQKDRFGTIKSTPEGIVTKIKVTTDLKSLSSYFKDILSSAMSYINAFSLENFIGKAKFKIQSINEFKLYNK